MVCDRSRVTDAGNAGVPPACKRDACAPRLATCESMAKAEPTGGECGRSARRGFKFARLSGLALFCSAAVATCGQKGPLSPPEQTLAEIPPGFEIGASTESLRSQRKLLRPS